MKNFPKLFLAAFCFSLISLNAFATYIEDGDYRVRCHTRNGGLRSLEAFPNAHGLEGVVRPRVDSTDQDQKWSVTRNGNYYSISCFTRNGGIRYLEAFPGSDLVRPKAEYPGNVDQLWMITLIDNDFYHISCNTANGGLRCLQAFPGAEDGEGVVRPREKSLDQDQRWQFIKWG